MGSFQSLIVVVDLCFSSAVPKPDLAPASMDEGMGIVAEV
jgi:hypothetical protein